jgi:hypothetical protein
MESKAEKKLGSSACNKTGYYKVSLYFVKQGRIIRQPSLEQGIIIIR